MENNECEFTEHVIKKEDLKDESGNYLGTEYTSESVITKKTNKTMITPDGDVCIVIN